jgi:hypothetical protein
VLPPEAKIKLAGAAEDRFFDLSGLGFVTEDSDSVRKVLLLLQRLRGVADERNQGKIE